VARYLLTRLRQIGIEHLYGVPGNHLGPFLSELHAMGGIEWVGTPTENGAGYAADGYARVRGVGAAAVTYGVGAFSLLNPIGGAYVEEIPLVVINATPTFEQWLNFRSIGLLTSHMSPRREANLDVYRQVTVDAQLVTSAGLAPLQIDAALTACLSERRPVYLEVLEDVWSAPCSAPEGEIVARPRPETAAQRKMLAKAVAAAVDRIRQLGRPIFWGGEEIDRQNLADGFQALVDATRIPFCTSIGGKSILSENHPLFLGVYNGKASLPEVRRMFKDVARCRVSLGVWTTSKNLSGDQALGEDWIVAAHDGVSVGSQYFPDVRLGDFLRGLREGLAGTTFESSEDYYETGSDEGEAMPESREAFLTALSSDPPDAEPLTYDGFFERINRFLEDTAEGSGLDARSPYSVISDAAFALLGSQSLKRVERRSFFAQNSWLAIGYSMGAATGIKSALPDRRPLVFVGDGSFQETCQEMSTHTRLGQDPVVFVLNNGNFYGIEQMLVHPCFYKEGSGEEPAFYNFLHSWSYARLAEVFGSERRPMTGRVLHTQADLDRLLAELCEKGNPINRGPILAQVMLPLKDFPRAIAYPLDGCL
jgi:indolepyruvate decarboxylase